MEDKIYTEKRENYDKLDSKLPILRVKSLKIYTGQKKFTRVPPVAPVTNMRYGVIYIAISNQPTNRALEELARQGVAQNDLDLQL